MPHPDPHQLSEMHDPVRFFGTSHLRNLSAEWLRSGRTMRTKVPRGFSRPWTLRMLLLAKSSKDMTVRDGSYSLKSKHRSGNRPLSTGVSHIRWHTPGGCKPEIGHTAELIAHQDQHQGSATNTSPNGEHTDARRRVWTISILCCWSLAESNDVAAGGWPCCTANPAGCCDCFACTGFWRGFDSCFDMGTLAQAICGQDSSN
jgi:hypothetical protein